MVAFPVQVFVAVVETPRAFLSFAARTEESLCRVIYEEFVVTELNGIYPDEEVRVRDKVEHGDYVGAVKYWFSEVGALPMRAVELHAFETTLIGAAGKTLPGQIAVAVTDDGIEGVVPYPAVAEEMLYEPLYESYVKPRLGTRHIGEEQVRYYIEKGEYAEAVQFWFAVIGPRYSENGEVRCRLYVMAEVPLISDAKALVDRRGRVDRQ